MPAPAITAAVLRGTQAMRAAKAAWQEERAMTKKAKEIKTVQKIKSEMQSENENALRLAKKLKQLKRIGWAIKGISLTFTSLGDILFSVWVFLFWANMELFIFPLFIPWWKQTTLEKAITVFLDLVIIFILFCIIGLVLLLVESVNEICGFLDDAQKSPLFIPVTIIKLIVKAIGKCPN